MIPTFQYSDVRSSTIPPFHYSVVLIPPPSAPCSMPFAPSAFRPHGLHFALVFSTPYTLHPVNLGFLAACRPAVLRYDPSFRRLPPDNRRVVQRQDLGLWIPLSRFESWPVCQFIPDSPSGMRYAVPRTLTRTRSAPSILHFSTCNLNFAMDLPGVFPTPHTLSPTPYPLYPVSRMVPSRSVRFCVEATPCT
jgi:hypothetical protein